MLGKNKHSYSYSSYGGGKSKSRVGVRWDRILPIGAIVIVVIAILIAFNFNRIKLATKGYSFSEQSEVLKLTSDKIKIITSEDKIEHISDWMALSKNVKYYKDFETYYNLHKSMKKKDIVKTVTDIFDHYVPDLKKLNYTDKEIWTILKSASTDDLQYLIDHQFSYKTIKPYMEVTGFKFADMDKYVTAYGQYHSYNYAVLYTSYPFIISTNPVTKRYTLKDPSSLTALVKPGFELPSNYTPKDLVTSADEYAANEKKGNETDLSYYKVRKPAYNAFVEMAKAAKKENYVLLINSAYRSYDRQKQIYQEYENKWGGKYAADHVAKPGTSEHQTGLGLDVTSQSVVDGNRLVFGDTDEYKWAVKNCYKYGFVLRFADGTSNITGITQEPWHFRYVGKKAAKQMHDNNWTLEEYVLHTGDLPKI